MPARAAAALLCLALAVTACAGVSTTPSLPAPSGAPTATPTERPVLSLTDVEVEPREIRRERVAVAFGADAAAELVTAVPAEIDFDAQALVCVFLGPRLTTGWSLDLRTASLTGGELRIRARETAPRTDTQPETTYPADCALLGRAALPQGNLRVWADDTVTDEFIADTVIEVPALGSNG
jgi:hypothetical protein